VKATIRHSVSTINKVFFLVSGQVNFYVGHLDTDQAAGISSVGSPSPNRRGRGLQSMNTRFFNDEKKPSGGAENEKSLTHGKLLFKIMTNGSYFGEVDIIFRRKRVYDLVTGSDCDLYILSRTEFENIVMNEYPHIYQEMKLLAVKRESKDVTMIEESLIRAKAAKSKPWLAGVDVETGIKNIRKLFKDSIYTEVDNHEIQPLEEMFDDMKEKLPLEELLDNFEVSRSEDGSDDVEASEDSDVKFDDVVSIGLEKMYSQFKGNSLFIPRFESEYEEQN
jgi:CRP-like cAMP-binding protein